MSAPVYISRHRNGVALKLKIQPNASRTEIVGRLGDRLKVCVAGPPVDGKANQELRKFLARRCRVPKSAVEILSGETSKNKSVLILGAQVKDVLATLGST